MEVLINVGTAIVGKLAEYTVDSVRCLFPYTSHVRSLRDRIQELRNKEKEFRVRVDAAKREGEEIVDKASTWLTTAGARSREAENFLNNECQANDRCFGGSLPNLVSRHRLSKRAKELAEDLANLIEGAGRIDRVSEPAALQGPVKNVGDYMAFASRKKILKGIMAALRDPGITKIGVCGMGGIGKTMLAYEVVRQATKEKLFSEVVITTISQNPNVHIIQQDIADKLHLSFGEVQNRHERAHRLQSHLKEAKKKILIILDDIWERLDLIEVVGIDFERDPLGCKVLLTYRDLNRVQSYMKVGKCFEVDVLRPEEERSLFNQIVGDNKLVEQPDFGPLATDIIGECGGLPLAIITVAYALKDRGLSVWKDALQQLRSSDLRGIEGMSDKVYKSIKLSYDFVKRKEEKSLLLLCSLYEEDKNIFIEELTRYCVGWGLLRNVHTLEEARTGVDSLVERLKARCLLLDGKFYGTVKMHDIIRDVAILIASEEHGMRSIMFDELEDHMKVKELHNSKAISILRCESCDNTARPHPERLECPQLELLLFMTKATHYGSKYNLNHLFVEAKELKTLSWNGTDIKSFGRSFGLLENLQTLCLRCREFEDTDLIGDLKNLRILDLSHSSVKQLTRKLGQLTRLQLLDLRGCDNLEVIEPNVISNLTRLEELYMAERFQGWEVEEEGINERRNASLMELKNLQRLTVLHLTVDNANILPRELFSRISIGTLVRYRISIGTLVGWKDYIGSPLDFISLEYEMSRSLTLKFNQSSQLIESGLELLMNGSEVLLLDGSNMGNRNVVCDLNRKGFPELKHLHFYNNDGVQFVVCSVDQIQPCRAFPSLETLKLGDLTNLERICLGKLTADSFNKLRKVYVIDCDKLKNLFPLSVVKRLHYIIVEGCEMMEEIVSRGRENHDASHEVEIFELRHLSLSFLPKFVEFCRSEMEATCGSSSIDSDSPKPIFSEQVSFPYLEELLVRQVNVEKMWPNELLINSSMQNLTELKVTECDSLKYLFPFVMAEILANLKRLEVLECKTIEDILLPKKEEGIRLEKIVVFPKLEFLELRDLRALKRFCAADSSIEFPSLKELRMEDCPELKTFVMPIRVPSVENQLPPFNEKVIFPSLTRLTCINRLGEGITHDKLIALNFKFLERYQNIEKLELRGFFPDGILWQHQQPQQQQPMSACLKELHLYNFHMLRHLFGDPSNTIAFPTLHTLHLQNCSRLQSFAPSCMSFHNLETLHVSQCHGLTYLLASSTATSLVRLKEMLIRKCKRMTEIINNDEEKDELVFRSLEILVLDDLPNLKSFYSGNNAISFPSLEKLYVNRCPEMRTFSHGIISTSSLKGINGARGLWDTNVNTTIRKLWEEDDSNSGLVQLFAYEMDV